MNIIDQKFFEPERWLTAIEKGVDKHISKTELRALTRPEVRIAVYNCVMSDNYEIAPPHTALIPKDEKGKFRTVYINENVDRIFLSILNDLLFELFPDMVHPTCKSYQKGIGCGKIVQQITSQMEKHKSDSVLGFKADLSKYFDSVPIEFIDGIFNEIERRVGKSKVISVARKYYHTDLYFDADGNLCEGYQSLKQGCALASFLADAILYDLDECLAAFPDSAYVRYSDDILFIGQEYEMAKQILEITLKSRSMKLNPKKFELITYDKWFKFLGFDLCGSQISLSKKRVKTFQIEIEKRTIRRKDKSLIRAVNAVNKYLYSGEYSWASGILPIINVEKDIETMNEFIMDCLRSVPTGKRKVGGLGVVMDREEYTILRGVGKNVTANRSKTQKEISGYKSLSCMRNALLTSKPVYEALVRQM